MWQIAEWLLVDNGPDSCRHWRMVRSHHNAAQLDSTVWTDDFALSWNSLGKYFECYQTITIFDYVVHSIGTSTFESRRTNADDSILLRWITFSNYSLEFQLKWFQLRQTDCENSALWQLSMNFNISAKKILRWQIEREHTTNCPTTVSVWQFHFVQMSECECMKRTTKCIEKKSSYIH